MRVVVAVLVVVGTLHAALWGALQEKQSAPDFRGVFPSVSYAPFEGKGHPDVDNIPTPERIRADVKILAPITKSIRLYSSTGGVELVPPIANEAGLKVSVGAWIDGEKESAEATQRVRDRNEREIQNAIALAKRNSNVRTIIVGNEVIYREKFLIPIENLGLSAEEQVALKEEEKHRTEAARAGKINVADPLAWADAENRVQRLIKLIQRVKRQVDIPVTTGEIWNIWVEHPELATAVDYVAAHFLPYWNGVPDHQAVEQSMTNFQRVRDAFPGKRITIAEFGWPSAGYNYHDARPGFFEQARVLREFVARVEGMGIDYNIVESIDQEWKTFEGGVGPYWGFLNASREAKFDWTGPIVNPDYWKIAAIAVLFGILLSLPIFRMVRPTAMQAGVLAIAANIVGAWFAYVFWFWDAHYFVVGAAFALALGVMLLIPLVFIALYRIEELSTIAFGRGPARLISKPVAAPDGYMPKVSIHVPAYREQPDMLKLTLDAVARLNYPNFECVVIINNTPDPAFWQPIQEHCRTLGERFIFINAEKVEGFKAGALRIAMARTAADAEIIGVIDADYVVEPNWLSDLVPAFADARVGLVQAPQDHRDQNASLMHYAMNGEYAGFFDIGMVERNESNAIIVHGTMCLIRRAAMDAAGGWAGDTICEDTDLGLSIIERGWVTCYTNTRYGYGLLPDTYEAFKKQRHRWAYGGFQIVKKHWRYLLPKASRLTAAQKREFSLGWLNWLGAESVGVVVAILNILWVPVVSFLGVAIPDKVLTFPIVATFIVSTLHFLVLYRLRVRVGIGQMIASMFTAMSVQWTVARAVGNGLVTDHLPFARTSKGGLSRVSVEFQAFWEAVIGALLLIGAAVLIWKNDVRVFEIYVFAGVLVLQSLPFLAAVGIALLENSRINQFAFWSATSQRTAELIGLRPIEEPTALPVAQQTVREGSQKVA